MRWPRRAARWAAATWWTSRLAAPPRSSRPAISALLDWCGELAADVVGRAEISADGIAWSNTEHTRTPPGLPPEPLLMQGTAGVAGWLARLHAAREGAARPVPVTGIVPAWL